MVSEKRLNIGGFTISVTLLDDLRELVLPSSYIHFVSDKEPDVYLRIHRNPLPFDEFSREEVFDSGPNWSLYRSSGKYILKTMFQEAIFNSDFRFADLYMPDEQDGSLDPAFFCYPLDQILLINLLCQNQGILLHACGIVDNGEGILFCGMSGQGKSTLANIWKNEKGSVVLSDDRVIARSILGDLMASGTPWPGEGNHCSHETVRLRKIFFIEHAKRNWVRDLSQGEAVSSVLTRSFLPLWDKAGMERTLEFIDTLSRKIPCYALGFVPDDRIVQFVQGK